ncbi:SDR family NAD(P)-dependent oxidoreductase [Paenibacillus chibensis]|uniref:SDR family NAD(P)-dependent oxidoreductase n=1 Tax=Paenibacillus chibensis TaxID=59846 RepID=UPI000FD7112F|nr:SDR family oxidoreductase [Paenibacillus chibensis]MEC0368432.1 SDR family NAD(P)-dependent oxidoreductase [Paenibacillus chibensis]
MKNQRTASDLTAGTTLQASDRKVAIITGGASGIGRALCKEAAARDMVVIVADIQVEGGEETVRQLREAGQGEAYFEKLDVTSAEAVEELVNRIFNTYGRLDYMFNNAGIAMYGELCDMSLDLWHKIMNVNLWGAIHGTHAAYPLMKRQGFGYIVNTSSATGLGPAPMSSAYATTKHAVVGMTTSLHYEAEVYGIHVSALCPAFVDTPIYATADAVGMDKNKINEQVNKQKSMSPEQFAKIAFAKIHRHEAVICPMPMRRTMDLFFLLFPAMHRKLMRLVCRISREASLRNQTGSQTAETTSIS